MTTENPSATAPELSMVELMRQAERSTANIGWLQDYLQKWETLRSICGDVLKAQKDQRSMDLEAREMLIRMRNFADDKCETLQQAYMNMYVVHLRLMNKITEGEE